MKVQPQEKDFKTKLPNWLPICKNPKMEMGIQVPNNTSDVKDNSYYANIR
jgi:hypothetical protein